MYTFSIVYVLCTHAYTLQLYALYTITTTGVPINHKDDVEDQNEYTDTDLGEVEEHKSIILHLLSQLKLGMDLTKVWLLKWAT